MLFPNKVLIVLQQELRPSLGTSDHQPEISLTGLEIPVQHPEAFILKVQGDTLLLQELLGVTTDVICILMLLAPHQFMVLRPP